MRNPIDIIQAANKRGFSLVSLDENTITVTPISGHSSISEHDEVKVTISARNWSVIDARVIDLILNDLEGTYSYKYYKRDRRASTD